MVDDVWTDLLADHRRVAAARPDDAANAMEHRPKAAVLACSDARVPPSVVFDQPAGSLFVVRLAGHAATPAALASLDYAVANLGVDLVGVIGHTGCGAVAAAASGTCTGELESVVAPICALIDSHPEASLDELVLLNVAETMRALCAHDGEVGRRSRQGSVQIRGAVHDLNTGDLEIVDTCTILGTALGTTAEIRPTQT